MSDSIDEDANTSERYVVSMKNPQGAVTWSNYKSEAAFNEFYAGKMDDGSGRSLKDVYEIVAQGITPEKARELTRASLPRHMRGLSVG